MDRVEKRKTTTILIVDDSELNRVMLAAMLGENYEILEASDGVEAFLSFKNMKPVLIWFYLIL